MHGNARETISRFGLFFLCIVILSLCIGFVFSHLPLPLARNFAMLTALIAAFISYSAAIKPGWLYESLFGSRKEQP